MQIPHEMEISVYVIFGFLCTNLFFGQVRFYEETERPLGDNKYTKSKLDSRRLKESLISWSPFLSDLPLIRQKTKSVFQMKPQCLKKGMFPEKEKVQSGQKELNLAKRSSDLSKRSCFLFRRSPIWRKGRPFGEK